jgi:signal transduction histidine kinase
MAFNRFTLSVLLQVVMIAATGLLMVWSFYQSHLLVARLTFTLVWIGQVIWLLYYVTRTNRSLTIFLESLKGADFVRNDHQAPSFDTLNISYNQIIDVVKNARMERQEQYHYFQYTLELIPVGILSFNKKDGHVEILNTAARHLLGVDNLHTLNDLETARPAVVQAIREMTPGRNRLIEMSDTFHKKQLLIRSSEFTLFGRNIQLVSFQNIRQALEEEQLHAWQKLISVLRHEIMNSVGPVSSLSRTLLRMFRKKQENKKPHELNEKTIDDAVTGLQSIESRAQGMMRFVESYRELTKIPEPLRDRRPVDQMLARLQMLMKDQLEDEGVKLVVEPPSANDHLNMDDKQITQVLINLVKNAAEAFHPEQQEKCITLRSFRNEEQQCCISVEDNGAGIPDELKDQIFIPFFTTKTGGSGIGLSFARQIMYLHEGRLSFSSSSGEGSRFVLEFP